MGLLLDCDSAEEQTLIPRDKAAVVHLGLCPARGLVCMLHSAGPVPPDAFEKMVLLAKQTAEAAGAEVRRCLETRAASRAARIRLEERKRPAAELANGDVSEAGGVVAMAH